MTYHQKYELLRADFKLKGERLIQAEKALTPVLGYGDSSEINDFVNADVEFDQARIAYQQFLLEVKSGNIDMSREYGGSL